MSVVAAVRTTTVAAVEWRATEELAVAERRTVAPGRGELAVQVGGIGVCGTDLAQWRGTDGRTRAGTVIGHEFGGTVTAIGPETPGWAPGDLVAIDPNLTCGRCAACRVGDRGGCAERRLLGFDVDGGMRERLVVPAAAAIRVPTGTDPRALALVEPLAVGVHAVDRAGVAAAQRVGVIGGGAIGASAARAALERGALPVVIEPDPARCSAVAALGIDVAAKAEGDWDVAIDTVGIQPTVAAALDRLVRGGTLCIVGLAHGGAMPSSEQLVRRELQIRGTFCYTRDDLEHAAGLVGRHGLGVIPSELVLGLAAAPAAIRALASGALGSGKTVVVP